LKELVNNHSTADIDEYIQEFCAFGVSGSTSSRKPSKEAELSPPREWKITTSERLSHISSELGHEFGEETLFIRQKQIPWHLNILKENKVEILSCRLSLLHPKK